MTSRADTELVSLFLSLSLNMETCHVRMAILQGEGSVKWQVCEPAVAELCRVD